MNRCLALVFVSVFAFSFPADAQTDLTGEWKGYIIYSKGKDTVRYDLLIAWTQQNNITTGTARTSMVGNPAIYSLTAVRGQWKNNSRFEFEEDYVIQQNLQYGTNFCIKSGVLKIKVYRGKTYLEGDWDNFGEGEECTAGKLQVERVDNQVFQLTGLIQDGHNKLPMQAEIRLEGITRKRDVILRSDQLGHYKEMLPRGTYALTVSENGYFPHTELISASEVERLIERNVTLYKMRTGVKINMQSIGFEAASSVLSENSHPVLKRFAAFMKENPDLVIRVNGHTDSGSSNASTIELQELSEMRARSVMDFLLQQGVPERQLSFKGFGNSFPISDNSTPEGRKLNRRTEFEIMDLQRVE